MPGRGATSGLLSGRASICWTSHRHRSGSCGRVRNERRRRAGWRSSSPSFTAQRDQIALGLEPVNRYETYLSNTIADTLARLNAIGAANVTIHVDTYHMNIEEPGFRGPLEQAGGRLGCIHCSESDRGVPGQGNVHWDEVFQGLKAIDYRGPLVLESFAAINPDLAGATCMWRPPASTSEQLAREGVAFLRERAAAVGLA